MTFAEFSSMDSPAEAAKRIKSAASAKLTPMPGSLDTVGKTAKFSGNHGQYEATLNSCPCADFKRRKFPCKHMYRLAYELGDFSIDNVKSDETKITATTIAQRKKILQSIELTLKSCPVNEVKALHSVLYFFIYYPDEYPVSLEKADCEFLLHSGIVLIAGAQQAAGENIQIRLSSDAEAVARKLYEHVNSILYPQPLGKPILLFMPDGTIIQGYECKE